MEWRCVVFMIDKFVFGSLEEVSDWIKRLSPIPEDKIYIDYTNNRFYCVIQTKRI